jgi:hypothetical protein
MLEMHPAYRTRFLGQGMVDLHNTALTDQGL